MSRAHRLLLAAAALCTLSAASPGSARAQFGRNKVQYQPRDFRIIETAHFDIYYYEEERDAAVDAARMAERIYGRLSRILDHDFRDRKPIILYASQTDFQQTNVLGGHIDESTGGVTESLKDRVLLPLTGSYEEFEHVLGHELVHSFQFDILRRSAVEQTASPFRFVPSLWFMEGMAEYLSMGRIDPKTVAWLRDATLDGYLRTIEEMDRFNDFLSYRFGQSLWNYIGQKWGDETIGLLLKRAASLGAERAFRRTLGVGLDDLSREWHEAVRAAYLPQVQVAGTLDGIARRITDHRFPKGREKSPSYIAPALSPDGMELVYLSDRGNDLYSFYDLYLADAETGQPRRTLVKSARGGNFESLRYLTSSAEFAPDGDRVAFVAKAGGRDAIYVIDARNGKIERKWVPDLNGVQSPTWSPDGRRIAFSGLRGGISNLYIWDLAAGQMQELTADRYARLHPVWSPDGRWIAFATDEGTGTDFDLLVFSPLRLALYDLETDEIRLLEDAPEGTNINPAWSPDGKAIAFLSSRTGVFNVFLYDLESGGVLQVTDVLTGVMGLGALLTSPGLSWARSADRIAFSYFEEAGFNIYTLDDPRRLARSPRAERRLLTAADEIGRPRVVEGRTAAGEAREDDTPSSFFLTEEGFRRSDFGGEARERTDPGRAVLGNLSIAALRDSAALALPDTAALAFQDYRVSLTPDVVGRPTIGAQVGGFFGNGVYGGSFVSLTDMLGNHNMLIAGDVRGSFDNARIFTSYTYLKNRVNFGVSFQQYPFFRFLGTRLDEIPTRDGELGEFNLFQRDQFRSVSIDAQYPISAFSRLEFGVNASSIQRDLVFQGISRESLQTFSITLDGTTRTFVKPYVGYTFDNSLPGFTGPLAGRRLRVQVSPYAGDLNMADALVDLRNYVRLPLVSATAFAQRLLSFTRFSTTAAKDAEEYDLAWGGPYFLRGYDLGSFGFEECRRSQERSRTGFFCPAQQELIGTSVLLLNSELRVPLLNPIKDGWLPLNFPPIDAALFFDVGVVFTPGATRLVLDRKPGQDIVDFREPLTSYGASLRVNLFFAVLRLDYSVAPSRGFGVGDGIWSLAFGEMF